MEATHRRIGDDDTEPRLKQLFTQYSGQPAVWLVALAIAAIATALILTWAFRRRRRARARRALPEARTRYPIVLAHGLFGFDRVQFLHWRHEYFRGVPRQLRRLGAEVHLPRVAPSSGIPVRAEQLAQRIRALPARRVNIVAHSMGGLDARYAIDKLGLAERVASLTTIGSPHRGTPLLDVTAGIGKRVGLSVLARTLGVPLDAFFDMTTARMAMFNRDVKDVRSVTYGCVIGSVKGGTDRINPLLVAPYLVLAATCGANDGLVPAASQAWGEVLETIDADHLAQIGWWKRFDAPEFYAGLMRELRARGF